MGGGVALFDYDNDGDLDVFVVQGHSLAPGAAGKLGPESWGRLFRNDLITPQGRNPTPRFVDVTAASGIRATGYGMGVATGDYDNDGWMDLYIANYGSNQLWHNNGDGTFTDVTAAAGVASGVDPRWSVGATFVDLDRDGWLDLFVLNYVDYSVQNNVRCYAPSSRRDYCGPQAFPPLTSRLLRNRGNGTFEDVSVKSGIGRKAGPGLGVVAGDLDGDGWPDLFVANDGSPSFLWLNQKDGTFKEDGLLAGVAVNAAGKPEAGMGIALGDCNGDGRDDLFITHLTGETNTLYLNQGGRSLRGRHRPLRAGRAEPSLHGVRHRLDRLRQRRLARPRGLQRRRESERRPIGERCEGRPLSLRAAGPALPQSGRAVSRRSGPRPARPSARPGCPAARPSATSTTTATRTSSWWIRTRPSGC